MIKKKEAERDLFELKSNAFKLTNLLRGVKSLVSLFPLIYKPVNFSGQGKVVSQLRLVKLLNPAKSKSPVKFFLLIFNSLILLLFAKG